MRKIVPELLELAFSAESPDRTLTGVESLLTSGITEAHLTGLLEKRDLLNGMEKLFSLSSYLTRTFLSSKQYLNLLIEEMIIRKSMKRMEVELQRYIHHGEDFLTSLGEYLRVEEIRLGILFLMNVITTKNLLRYMSHLADVILKAVIERTGSIRGFMVIALGKLGGREMTFGSDLDIVFVSEVPDGLKSAEQIIKLLTAYTDRGPLYNIDMRLRPDGSKGALLKDIPAYRNYYMGSAQNWEIQALLKARTVGGDGKLKRDFLTMMQDVILKRSKMISREDISEMRERIKRELSHEQEGIDIKLGPGGIEEIEFYLQWLQLHHACIYPEVIVQNTGAALNRLTKKGIIKEGESRILSEAYGYLRRLETFMRLNEEHVIREEAETSSLAALFMGHRNGEEFLSHVHELRGSVLDVIGR
jgi:glutamate-ammonia-ligase adenylyltransferase